MISSAIVALRWGWIRACAFLLPCVAWGAFLLFPCWPRRWGFVSRLRDRARLPWTDAQMEAALAKAGAGKGEAR